MILLKLINLQVAHNFLYSLLIKLIIIHIFIYLYINSGLLISQLSWLILTRFICLSSDKTTNTHLAKAPHALRPCPPFHRPSGTTNRLLSYNRRRSGLRGWFLGAHRQRIVQKSRCFRGQRGRRDQGSPKAQESRGRRCGRGSCGASGRSKSVRAGRWRFLGVLSRTLKAYSA